MALTIEQQQQLVEHLIQSGVLDAAELERLKVQSLKEHRNLDELLVESSAVDVAQVFRAKAEVLGVPFVDLDASTLDEQVLTIIPEEAARNYELVAYKRSGNTIDVALADPQNFRAIQAVDFLAKEQDLLVRYALATPAAIQSALRRYSTSTKAVDSAVANIDNALEAEAIEELKVSGRAVDEDEEHQAAVIRSAPISKIVSVIIKHAVDGGASDIHIEPGLKETRVRYRVDGILHITLTLPVALHPAIVSRIKVLANLKLDETRKPQDGRIRLNIDNHDVDFRVSVLPLIDNEKVVMRILDTTAEVLTLEGLGFRKMHVGHIVSAISNSHGMILVTGPTGSGKTTTLYAALQLLNKEAVNILTLEDPIEYYLNGINQSQINPEVGLTFATGLRSILRQDPNIIMVGEIRDRETAELAVHAALTGHLMLSTLHTSDVFGVIPRLIDMHVEPFLIASTLNLAIGQRLVRKICNFCRIAETLPDDLEADVRQELSTVPSSVLADMENAAKLKSNDKLTFARGKGCKECGDSGYKDRILVAEMLELTDNLQRVILSGSDIDAIKEEFIAQGMITLKQDGLLKALDGITTVEEVMRVTKE